jgi:hypothetical protein
MAGTNSSICFEAVREQHLFSKGMLDYCTLRDHIVMEQPRNKHDDGCWPLQEEGGKLTLSVVSETPGLMQMLLYEFVCAAVDPSPPTASSLILQEQVCKHLSLSVKCSAATIHEA